MPPRRIRVLVVDDSPLVRRLVTDALRTDPEIVVVGTAGDPYAARDKIQELQPDVLTLDLEMPRMDGLTFLRILMEQHPLPVIIMSSLSPHGSACALEALRLGAFDVFAKPNGAHSFGQLGPRLIARIKATALAPWRPVPALTARPHADSTPPLPPPALRCTNPARAAILLGASTGGTEALREVLTNLPAGLPGIAVVQHIPPVFSKTFADRLNTQCAFEVREAADGDRLTPNLALVAPGNFHLLLHWCGNHHRVRVVDGPEVWHQRPAVDLLFKSAAEAETAPHIVAGVLTGMGRDGADGLLRLRQLRASTFAQDESSSVVYGMPRAAWENGAAQTQLPLAHIAGHLVRHFSPAARSAHLV